MKKIFIAVFVLGFAVSYGQIINFPDPNFKKALVSSLCVDTNNDGAGDEDADLNNDGEIQVSEAEEVKSLYIFGKAIANLDGINYFKNSNCKSS